MALLDAGEMCVCDLAAAAGRTESAASHALRLLRAHRIVTTPRRVGGMAYHRRADSHVRLLLDVSVSHSGRRRRSIPSATTIGSMPVADGPDHAHATSTNADRPYLWAPLLLAALMALQAYEGIG